MAHTKATAAAHTSLVGGRARAAGGSILNAAVLSPEPGGCSGSPPKGSSAAKSSASSSAVEPSALWACVLGRLAATEV